MKPAEAASKARFVYPELAFDCGNHAAKIAAIGIPMPWSMRGLYTYVDPEAEFTPDQLDGGSFVVYHDGDRDDLVEKAWVVGPSVPDISRSYFRTLTAGKAESILQILAASLPVSQPTSIEINSLICSNPHPKFQKQAYQDMLVGTHHLSINGHETTLVIRDVTVQPEGYGALNYGIRMGCFKADEPVATIDCGGGTLIITAWSEKGYILEQGRRTLEDRGTTELVNAIIADPAMKRLLREDASFIYVMNAIEKGLDSEGRLLYEGNEALDFLSIFERHRKQWSKSILDEAMAVLSPWEKRIKRIGLIGGGSNLFQPLRQNQSDYVPASEAKVNPDAKCQVLPNPQYAHVLGLISTPPEQVGAVLAHQETAARSRSSDRNGSSRTKNPVLPVF